MITIITRPKKKRLGFENISFKDLLNLFHQPKIDPAKIIIINIAPKGRITLKNLEPILIISNMVTWYYLNQLLGLNPSKKLLIEPATKLYIT